MPPPRLSKPELLNAATEWNRLMPSAFGSGKSRANTGKLKTAPISSKAQIVKAGVVKRRNRVEQADAERLWQRKIAGEYGKA